MSFSRIYDSLMSDVDFEEIYGFIKPFIKDKKTMIDAGCGSGYLTTLFAKDFYVTGLDLDEDMLSLAKQKIDEKRLFASFYQHDLNNEIPLSVDVIISLFDVINYLEIPKQVFENFYDALNDDGILIFDCYKEEILEVYDNYEEIESEPFDYKWHIEVRGNKMYHSINTKEETDNVIQYVHPKDHLISLLESLNFKVQVIDGPDERKYYFIANK